MSRKNISLPLTLVIDDNLSTAAKVIYAVLKTFQTPKTNSPLNAWVIVTHNELMHRSNLSKHTIVKALNLLTATGWIQKQRNAGSANTYIFLRTGKIKKQR